MTDTHWSTQVRARVQTRVHWDLMRVVPPTSLYASAYAHEDC